MALTWEDTLKRGHYFVSDKVVKVSEALGGRLASGWSDFVEGYIERDFQVELGFRLAIRPGNSCDFHAILESASATQSSRILESGHQPLLSVRQSDDLALTGPGNKTGTAMNREHNSRDVVFVINPEAMKNPEGMGLWVVPSLVRLVGLETLNDVKGSLWKAADLPFPATKVLRTFTHRKGKLLPAQSRFRTSRHTPQPPNQIVKDGTEVMNTISCDEVQSGWRLFPALQLNPQELVDSITIYLGHHFIGYAATEPLGFTFEGLEVTTRPI